MPSVGLSIHTPAHLCALCAKYVRISAPGRRGEHGPKSPSVQTKQRSRKTLPADNNMRCHLYLDACVTQLMFFQLDGFDPCALFPPKNIGTEQTRKNDDHNNKFVQLETKALHNTTILFHFAQTHLKSCM